MQYTLITLALESRRQNIPLQCMHVQTPAANPPSDKYRVFCVQFPYGNVLRWI